MKEQKKKNLWTVLSVMTILVLVFGVIMFGITGRQNLKKFKDEKKEFSELQTKAKADSATSADRLAIIQGLNTTVAAQDSVVDMLRVENQQLSIQVLKEKKLAKQLEFQKDGYEEKFAESFRQCVDLSVQLTIAKASIGSVEEDNVRLINLYRERGKQLASLQRDFNCLNESFLHNNVVIRDVANGRNARQFSKWFFIGKDNCLDFTTKGQKKFVKK